MQNMFQFFYLCRYVSCVVGCPYEGEIKPEAVTQVYKLVLFIILVNGLSEKTIIVLITCN